MPTATTYMYTKKVNVTLFEQEIMASSIKTGISSVILFGETDLRITMKDALDSSEKDMLDALVAAHVYVSPGEEATNLRTTDKRLIVKTNSRPLNSSGYYTSRGDLETAGNIGGGTQIAGWKHLVGDQRGLNYTREFHFNVEGNRTWMFEGYLEYFDALFDEFSFEIRPRVTTLITGQTGTNYNLYMGYLLVPAAGNGTVAIPEGGTVYPCSVVPRTDTGVCPAAYWNFDYNSSNGTYGNMTARPNGDGAYNVFGADVCLKRYINRWVMLRTGKMHFSTNDPSQYGSWLRSVFKFYTRGNDDPTTDPIDHAWEAVINFSMFRDKIT